MSPYKILITSLAVMTFAAAAFAQGGMGGGGSYGGAGLAAPKASVVAVDNVISMMVTQLKQLDVQLRALKDQISDSESRVKSGREPAGEKLPNLKMQESQMQMAIDQITRQLGSAERLRILASPVDVSLKSATIRQAAEALSQASKLSIAVDPKVPQDIRVNADSQNVPLGAVLEVIAQNAGLIIAPTSQNGLLLRLPGKLVVDGKEYASEGSTPWSEDWGMQHTPFAPVGRRWLDLFDGAVFGGYGGMMGMPMMGGPAQMGAPPAPPQRPPSPANGKDSGSGGK